MAISKIELMDRLSKEGRSVLDDDAIYESYLEYAKDTAWKNLADNMSTQGRSVLDDDPTYEKYLSYKEESPVKEESTVKEEAKPAEPETIHKRAWDLKKSGIATPFVYTITAKNPISFDGKTVAIQAGDLADQIKLDEDMTPEEVLKQYLPGSWLDGVNPADLTITRTVSDNPEVVAQYIREKQPVSKYNPDLKVDEDMAYSSPRAARAAISKNVGVGETLAGAIGDNLSAAGRVVASGLGALGGDGDYSDELVSRLGRTGAVEGQGVMASFGEELARDPSAPLLVGAGGPVMEAAKAAPTLVRGLAGTTRAIEATKPIAYGAGLGAGSTGLTDLFNDYGGQQEDIGASNYAIGAIGGALIPTEIKHLPDFTPIGEKISRFGREFRSTRPSEIPPLQPNFGIGTKDVAYMPNIVEDMKHVASINPKEIPAYVKDASGRYVRNPEIDAQRFAHVEDDFVGETPGLEELKPRFSLSDLAGRMSPEGKRVNPASLLLEKGEAKYADFLNRTAVPAINDVVIEPLNWINRRRAGLLDYRLGEAAIRPPLAAAADIAGGMFGKIPEATAYKLPVALNAAKESYDNAVSEPEDLEEMEQRKALYLNQLAPTRKGPPYAP